MKKYSETVSSTFTLGVFAKDSITGAQCRLAAPVQSKNKCELLPFTLCLPPTLMEGDPLNTVHPSRLIDESRLVYFFIFIFWLETEVQSGSEEFINMVIGV